MVDLAEIQTVYYMVAATGVLVAAAYYIVALRSANRTRQAQLLMNIASLSFNNHEWNRAYKKFTDTQFNSAKDFIKMWETGTDNELLDAYNILGGFYESLGVFIKEGLIDIRLIALLMTLYVRGFYEKIAPYIDEIRRHYNKPRILSEAKYLYDELMKYLEKHPELKT